LNVSLTKKELDKIRSEFMERNTYRVIRRKNSILRARKIFYKDSARKLTCFNRAIGLLCRLQDNVIRVTTALKSDSKAEKDSRRE